MLFSLGYNDTAALSPWERYILYPFRLTAIRQLLCLLRVEAVKLAQAGFIFTATSVLILYYAQSIYLCPALMKLYQPIHLFIVITLSLQPAHTSVS